MSKWDVFYEQLITQGGYKDVLLGLRNTLVIAVCGLLIGIFIGTVIACVQVAGKRNKIAKGFSCFLRSGLS